MPVPGKGVGGVGGNLGNDPGAPHPPACGRYLLTVDQDMVPPQLQHIESSVWPPSSRRSDSRRPLWGCPRRNQGIQCCEGPGAAPVSAGGGDAVGPERAAPSRAAS